MRRSAAQPACAALTEPSCPENSVRLEQVVQVLLGVSELDTRPRPAALPPPPGSPRDAQQTRLQAPRRRASSKALLPAPALRRALSARLQDLGAVVHVAARWRPRREQWAGRRRRDLNIARLGPVRRHGRPEREHARCAPAAQGVVSPPSVHGSVPVSRGHKKSRFRQQRHTPGPRLQTFCCGRLDARRVASIVQPAAGRRRGGRAPARARSRRAGARRGAPGAAGRAGGSAHPWPWARRPPAVAIG